MKFIVPMRLRPTWVALNQFGHAQSLDGRGAAVHSLDDCCRKSARYAMGQRFELPKQVLTVRSGPGDIKTARWRGRPIYERLVERVA